MPEYFDRDWWTDTAPGGSTLTGPNGFAVHYPGDPGDRGVLTESTLNQYLDGIRDYHVRVKGWSDIAYQWAIDQAGRIVELRGTHRRSAANGDTEPNADWGALFLVIGNTEEPTEAMLAAAREWRARVWLAAFPDATKVVGHRDVRPDPTECPGDTVMGLIHAGEFTAAPDNPPEDDMPTIDEVKTAVRQVLDEQRGIGKEDFHSTVTAITSTVEGNRNLLNKIVEAVGEGGVAGVESSTDVLAFRGADKPELYLLLGAGLKHLPDDSVRVALQEAGVLRTVVLPQPAMDALLALSA